MPELTYQHVGIGLTKFHIWRYKKKTCHPVILLMDNDPDSFKAFQRENVVMRYVSPNVTSWKQPYDLGVIAYVKRRYKILLLKDVLSFQRLEHDNQHLLKEKYSKFRRYLLGLAMEHLY